MRVFADTAFCCSSRVKNDVIELDGKTGHEYSIIKAFSSVFLPHLITRNDANTADNQISKECGSTELGLM